jgi:hypothetical protein
MGALFAATFVPWRKQQPAIVPSKNPAIRVVSIEYGKPDPKNVTITLEWIGKRNYTMSIGEPFPGTTLRFFGIKRRGSLYASFIDKAEREVAIKEEWTVELPSWCLQ